MADNTFNRPSLTTNLVARYNNLGGKYDPMAVHFFQSVFAQGFTLNETTTEFTFQASTYAPTGNEITPYYVGVNA